MVVVTHDHKAVNVYAMLFGSVGQAIIEDSFSIAGRLEEDPILAPEKFWGRVSFVDAKQLSSKLLSTNFGPREVLGKG